MSKVLSPGPLPTPLADSLGLEPAQELLRLLADPIRMQVVEALAGGERCVCELTEDLQIGQSRLSFHLRVMKQAGLISARQQGRWIYYQLVPEQVRRLASWLEQLALGCTGAASRCG